MSSRSTYRCTEAGIPKSEYGHYSLCLETYTQFTSPLRRYVDIVAQRLLDGDCGVVDADLCKKMNERSLKASNFEKDSDRVDFSLSMMYESINFLACIESNTKKKLNFALLDIKLSRHFYEIRVLNLGPFLPRQLGSEGRERQKYSWKIKISSLEKFSLDNFHGATMSKLSEENNENCTSFIETFRNEGEKLGKSCHSIQFKHLCALVNPSDWKNVLTFTKNPTVENLKFTDCLNRYTEQAVSSHCSGVHIGTAEYPFLNYVLSLPLREAEVFNIWLTMRKKKCLPESVLQVVELSPLFRVCIQHNAHPAYCFSDFFLKQASKPQYKNIYEYVELWQSVLLAEAAVSSVNEAQTFILRDVKLNWPKFTLCPATTDGTLLYMVSDFIEMKIPEAYIDSMSEYFNAQVGDLVCARYGVNRDCNHKKVFHFVIGQTKKHPKDQEGSGDISDKKNNGSHEWNAGCTIRMRLCKQENRISKDMMVILTQAVTCEIQMISMSVSYR